MADEINIRSTEPEVTLPVRLDGLFYRLQVQWNTREGFWSLSISASDGRLLLGHQRITLLVDMLRSHVSEDIPPGALVAVDTSGQDIEPERDDLGNGRVKLVYLSSEEVARAS
jgi:hypothetical protein